MDSKSADAKSNAPAHSLPDNWGRRNSAGVSIASSLRLENISLSLQGNKIVNDVSFEVAPGKVLCLLGPSGSGKTSILRIAAGLIENASGRVFIDGRIVADEKSFLSPEKRGIGLVFQDYALFPHLTILQNVEFGLTAMKGNEAREQALRMLSRVGLEERADQYPHVLSGGEQQRVALARALAPRPGILLMDEPFSGLDSRLRDTIREQSISLLKETRSTAIIVTHDAEEALRVADEIALIRDGKLVQIGSGRDLYYNPESLFVAGFFSEINVLPISLKDGKAQSIFGSRKAQFEGCASGFAAIRQSDIAVAPYKAGASGVPGRITERRFLGTGEMLNIAIEGIEKPIQARVRSGKIHRDKTAVMVDVDPELMMIFPDVTK